MTTAPPDAAARPLPDRQPATEGPVDVLIVGAGISGIGAACHLRRTLPGKSLLIVDGRDSIGGTWDLFRYPGIRSDSDLESFAYAFKPWTSDNSIADGSEILSYLQEAVDEHDLGSSLRMQTRVTAADWDSAAGLWTVQLVSTTSGQTTTATCRWLFSGTGYYRHDKGHRPHFPGEEDFAGQIIHPQGWPEDLDYTGRRVVVIGSGATAITLVPAMADKAAHVTMLQRSPTYIMPLPGKNPIALGLRRVLPEQTAYAVIRRINIALATGAYNVSRRYPTAMRRVIRRVNKAFLPSDYPVDVHFKPAYGPWDERMCMARDGDLFKAIRTGAASVVTDHIDRFTERGISLASGEHLDADIVVTATGLQLLALGGMELSVDGTPVDLRETIAFRSMMLSGIPNFSYAFGYTNASWTLKVDLVCEHLCRMLQHMDEHGYDTVVPVPNDPTLERRPLLDFRSGYVQRSIDDFPRQGSHAPWNVEMSYAVDRQRLRTGPVEDPALHFGTVGSTSTSAVAAGAGALDDASLAG